MCSRCRSSGVDVAQEVPSVSKNDRDSFRRVIWLRRNGVVVDAIQRAALTIAHVDEVGIAAADEALGHRHKSVRCDRDAGIEPLRLLPRLLRAVDLEVGAEAGDVSRLRDPDGAPDQAMVLDELSPPGGMHTR